MSDCSIAIGTTPSYFFMLNADEQIYMRYGGRDSQSPDTYLNLNSLELALKQGLELHRQYLKGELKKTGASEAAASRATCRCWCSAPSRSTNASSAI